MEMISWFQKSKFLIGTIVSSFVSSRTPRETWTFGLKLQMLLGNILLIWSYIQYVMLRIVWKGVSCRLIKGLIMSL